MRLRRLDLTRYGKFTDHTLDFGPRSDKTPDLHVIYGPNEAGKSTALSAFLDLLYGIEMRSPYNFLHPYKAMQIGGALEQNGTVSEWVRVKTPQNSLRDGQGDPVGDHALAAMLGGIDRDAYRSMFSLDDDTLEQGGEDILKSEGDLGSLLFAASAGLSDLAQRLDDLKAEADAFHRGRARSTELAALKAELNTLKAQRDDLDTQASEYARLVKARDQASEGYDEAVKALGAAKARADEIARLKQGLEHAAFLSRLTAEMETYASLPEPPPDWAKAIGPLMTDDTRLTTERAGLDDRIKALTEDLEAIQVDEAVLALAERAERLQGIEGRYSTAADDLPRRRLERRDLDTQIAGLLRRLERSSAEAPHALVLPASTVGTLRDLIARRSGVAEKLEAARTEHTTATGTLGNAQADLQRVMGGGAVADAADQEPDPTPWHTLEAAVRSLSGDDSLTRAQIERQARTGLADKLTEALAALAPWTGDADALAALPVPDAAQLEAWRASIDEAEKNIRDHGREVARLEGDYDRRVAEMDAVRSATGVVDDETATALRSTRNDAWQAHRTALNGATADAFAHAMRNDDAARENRMDHVTDVARLRERAVTLAGIKAGLANARDQHKTAQTARDAVQGVAGAALAALGLPSEDWPLGSLTGWLDRRATALEARANLRNKDRDTAKAEDDAKRARDRLLAALSAAGVPAPPEATLPALLDTANGALKQHTDRTTRLDSARKALDDATRAVADRTRALNTATAAEAEWRAAWDAALSGCWLGTDGARPAPEAVAAMLTELDDLKSLLRDRDDKDHRIRQMEEDQSAYVAALSGVLAELGEPLDPTEDDPVKAADALRKRLATAREADGRRKDRQTALDTVRKDRAALDVPLATLTARTTEMTALFGVETLAEVSTALRRVTERTTLRNETRKTEAALTGALQVPDMAAAEQALADVDPDALTREATELATRVSDLEARHLEQRDSLTRAKDALATVQGDGAVARLDEQRRTLLLDIENKAERHLRLRLGIAAATRALSLYQERHRSTMLKRAGEAFATVSRGAYSDLSMQFEKDGEKLVALDAGGGSKIASALSKGTRFQLYLALRVAGYHEFASRNAPVPFVADDIMETFDDFRAEEAFRLFAGMAEAGQVIYLTHHRHLCDIARAVCPTVTVHTLNGPAPRRPLP